VSAIRIEQEGDMHLQERAFARLIGATVLLAVATAAPARAQANAASSVVDRFIGTWQEDESKRQIGSLGSLIFRRNDSGGVEEIRGGEARPLVQQVIFDGKTRATAVTDNNGIAWKQIDPRTFERAMTNKGRLVNTRRLRISADGKTLTQDTEQEATDGRKVITTTVFQRTTGESSGLVGRWRPQSVKTSSPGTVKYERAGPNALKFTNSFGNTYVVALDDKPVPTSGPATIAGSMIAAKQTDDRTIETTSSREGVITGRSKRVISADGRTMTVTTTIVGANAPTEPSVSVFVKQ
jgi:hypothetical protein